MGPLLRDALSVPTLRQDAFASVMGLRRGASRDSEEEATTDLDRARMLFPLVARALTGPDYLDSAIALNHAAAAMRVEVLHGRFVADPDHADEASLTLLRTRCGALIGVVDLDTSGTARLLRPDWSGQPVRD